MAPRLRYLVERRADGSLTPVERAELSRLERGSPEARREAAAWVRFEAGLRGALDGAPPLSEARLARAIERRAVDERRFRPWAAAAAIAVVAVAALAPSPRMPAVTPPVVTAPPVDVDLDGPHPEVVGLVRIEL